MSETEFFLRSYQAVYEIFKNEEKTLKWFISPNPNLGKSSPLKLLLNGRGQKVWSFIQAMREGY